MRYAKTALAVLAAVLAMTAIAGASSASAATVLCDNPETPCLAKYTAPSGSPFAWIVNPVEEHSGTSFKIGSYECNHVYTVAHTSTEGGNPLLGNVVEPSLMEGCKFGGMSNSCSAASMNAAPISISATGGGDGTVTYGTASNPLSISLSCHYEKEEWTCVWNSTGAAFKLSGSPVRKVTAEKVPLTRVSGSTFWCPSSPTMSVTADHIGSGPFISSSTLTVLCDNPETPCLAKYTAPSGSPFAWIVNPVEEHSGTSFKIGSYECNHVYTVAHTSTESGNPLLGNVVEPSLMEGCKFGGMSNSCSAASMNAAPISISATGGGDGTVTYGTASNPLSISLSCHYEKEEWTCVWNSTGAAFKLSGSPVRKVTAEKVPLTRVSGSTFWCPSSPTMSVTADHIGSGPFISTI